MARMSVTVWPPPPVMAELAALPRPTHLGVRWCTPEQWLVKIRPLGFVDEAIVPTLVDALERDLDGAPATRCALGSTTRRLGGQWLGVPVSGLLFALREQRFHQVPYRQHSDRITGTADDD